MSALAREINASRNTIMSMRGRQGLHRHEAALRGLERQLLLDSSFNVGRDLRCVMTGCDVL